MMLQGDRAASSAATSSSSRRQVETRIVEILDELKPGRELYTNVEFYAGVVMELLRPPTVDVHPDVRVEPGHRLVRQHPRAGGRQQDHPPGARYVGPPPPQPVPAIEG